MESVSLDTLDLRLLHALHLDGRAPFSTIAEVLGVSDRTVARRFGRLRAAGAVRVTAVTDVRRTGHAEWLVRVRVRPGAAAAVAGALARRSDTAWVTVLSSGAAVVCLFRVADGGPVPLDGLGRHPGVIEVDAQRVLRHLMGRRWVGRTSALAPDEAAALRPPRDPRPDPLRMSDLDGRLLPVLAADGRTAYPVIAREVGWSESAVRRRLAELRHHGLLRFDVEVDPGLLGYHVQCLLWLYVSPARLASTARDLAAQPETAYVGATTGERNLLAIAICRNTDTFYEFLTERLGALEGVERLETAPVAGYAKRAAPVG
ncbi:Lrp/AsnC family transcriptional regulator [Streptomyces capparidis]